MKIKNILVEDIDHNHRDTYLLWESVGHRINEAALSADQISQIFQNIETGQTAAGSNRTLIGKGKDVAVAAKQAYNNLKDKVYDSGPMKNFAAAYDRAAEKLKDATGGDQGAMQYVEKYRKFATKHPILQGAVYAALIAAAGVSGAGAGGAAALGLLKMTDKLLQGEDIRTALYKGAKTGAIAYGASKLGDLIRGDKGQTTTNTSTTTMTQQGYIDSIPLKGQVHPDWLKQFPTDKFQYQWDGSEGWRVVNKASDKLMATFTSGSPPADTVMPGVASNWESVYIQTRPLSEGQVYLLFSRLEEGIFDKLKAKAQQVGKNITTKITADKLNSAWRRAGSPTDSAALASFLRDQGVDDAVINSVFKSMKISTVARNTDTLYSQTAGMISKLDKKGKQRLIAYLQSQLGTA